MNPESRRERPAAKLSASMDQRLNSYTFAARAAGVGILALAVPVEGKIVYTPAHHTITHGGSFKLDLNHDGITDFTLQDSFMTNCSTFISRLSVKPATGNGAQGWTGFQPYAFALKRGAKIGAADYFPGRQMASVDAGPGGIYYPGSWVNVKNRYLGLQFKIKGKTHYGWARLSVSVQTYKVIGTLTGYAYETIANEAIIAGKTKGPDVITVQPATLGRLAQGASHLADWR
jgi:hypothetical protein